MDKAICGKCGSVYEIECHKIPCRDKDSLTCEVCGNDYMSWNSSHYYTDKLIERKELKSDKK